MPASASCRRTTRAHRTELRVLLVLHALGEDRGGRVERLGEVRVTTKAPLRRVNTCDVGRFLPPLPRAHSAFYGREVSSAVCPAKQPGLLN